MIRSNKWIQLEFPCFWFHKLHFSSAAKDFLQIHNILLHYTEIFIISLYIHIFKNNLLFNTDRYHSDHVDVP